MIERIFTRPPAGGAPVEHTRVHVATGAGIQGDRYFDRHEEPGQNLTLIEAEEIERFNAEQGLAHDPALTGRNLVTRGVRLNDLVGQEFSIGQVRLRGVELCEPCLGFGEVLARGELTPAAVVKAFVGKAGLRADVLSSGEVALGDALGGALLPDSARAGTALPGFR